MTNHLKDEHLDSLFSAILLLKDKDECYKFFDDLCTVAEIKSMQQRFQVALMLEKGMVYNDICKETGASTATISRVNRSLMYGADGYKLIFDRMKDGE